jgi:hypothetical protein
MEATLHLMVEPLRELKCAANAGHLELKAEINAVTAGQEELEMEMNAEKTDINGVKTDISVVTAGQEENKNDMKSEMSAVKSLGNKDKRRPRRIERGNRCLSGENKGRPG